jgi:3-phenylpropionate/cinnamic acid dioxygenase small subunit
MTQSFRDDQIITYRGWAEHRLVPQGDSWAIAGKRTVVLDPITDTVLDFYMI